MHITARCIAATVALCTALGGTAAAEPPVFKTPDGEVNCFFEKPRKPRYAHCNWSTADDEGVEVSVRGKARMAPAGGHISPEGVPVLRRGASQRAGKLRCTSRRYGMRCVSLVTFNGFRVGPRIQAQLFAGTKPCRTEVPEGAGVSDVRARGVSCKRARRVARGYFRTHEVRGWECRERRLDLEFFRVRCTRDDAALVRFAHGS
jgi:hypothetical protein